MIAVRMAEIAVSKTAGDELVALGLGSCIGLAVIDRSAGVAGLAHIVLPESGAAESVPGKFADLAVPELLRQIVAAGGAKRRLEAAIAGGARMFAMSGGMDIGGRNERAVRVALDQAGVAVQAAETGGNQGRTVRVTVGEFAVTSRVAGGAPSTLLAGTPGRGSAASVGVSDRRTRGLRAAGAAA